MNTKGLNEADETTGLLSSTVPRTHGQELIHAIPFLNIKQKVNCEEEEKMREDYKVWKDKDQQYRDRKYKVIIANREETKVKNIQDGHGERKQSEQQYSV